MGSWRDFMVAQLGWTYSSWAGNAAPRQIEKNKLSILHRFVFGKITCDAGIDCTHKDNLMAIELPRKRSEQCLGLPLDRGSSHLCARTRGLHP